AVRRRPAIDEPLHEGRQSGDIERLVLEVADQKVEPRLRHLQPLLVAEVPGRGVGEDLTPLQQGERAVDLRHGVLPQWSGGVSGCFGRDRSTVRAWVASQVATGCVRVARRPGKRRRNYVSDYVEEHVPGTTHTTQRRPVSPDDAP